MSLSKPAVDKETLDFVELLSEEYNCPVCLGFLQEPYLTACCGNHFCKECIDKVKENNDKCPLCQAKPLIGVINKHFKRKLNELKVYCIHRKEGCKWKGDYGKLNQHLATDKIKGECQFVILKCPLSTMCGIQLPRKSLIHHTKNICAYREFSCKHCGFLSSYHVVTTQHINKCVNYPISCPNECSKQTYPRSQLKSHLTSCPEQMVDCNFKEMGCKVILKRHLLQQHLESNSLQHQMIMCQAFKSLQRDKEVLERKVTDLTEEVARSSSEVDYWANGFKLVAAAMKENDWPLYLSKMTEIAAIRPVAPLIYRIPLHITQAHCNGCCERFRKSISHSHYEASSYFSTPFYSHPNGYKMQLMVKFVCHCLDCRERSFSLVRYSGSRREDSDITASILVDLYLSQGEYDAQLTWPYEGNATVTLLNEHTIDHHQKLSKTFMGNRSIDGRGVKLNNKQPSQPKDTRVSQIREQLRNYNAQTEQLKQLYQEYYRYVKADTLCFAFNSKRCISKFVCRPGIHTSNYIAESETDIFLEIKFV